MNSQVIDHDFYEDLELIAGFQLFLGKIFRINDAVLKTSENNYSKDLDLSFSELIKVIDFIRILRENSEQN